MQKLFVTASFLAALAAPAAAQCFETNFGTLCPGGSPTAGLGDDLLFTLQPMTDGVGGGIASFPMGGIASSYTHAHIGSNGVIFLTTGAASGATTTGYSSSATTMVSNLRGTATQPPRLAVYWRDLNNLSGNNGGVYFNNTIPGKFVVTWKNTVAFSNTPPVFTCQAQIFADGHVVYFYSGTAQNATTCPIVGISQGALVADPGASNLLAGATSTTKIMYQTFATANTFTLANTALTFTPNVGGGYDESSAPCVPATNTGYGAGCYNLALASIYENFATAPAFDLANTSVSYTNTGTGYAVTNGTASLFTHVTPTVLSLTDDSEAAVTLSASMPYPGGATASLAVCSNGFISVATGNGTGFSPTVSTFLAAPQTGWWTWHDFNPAAVGSGSVKFEEAGGIAYVTWDGVYNFSGTTAADASTIQYQFDEATGNVTVVFGTMSSTGGTGFLVGYSPGGANLDPGTTDFSTQLPKVTSPDQLALALAVAPSPVLGTTLVYTTTNIPAATLISGLLVSLGQIDPGIDLGGMGAPGCFQLVDLSTASTFLMFSNPTDTVNLTIPNNSLLVGLPLNAQAASLVPGVNALGLLTSNAFRSVVNSF